MANGQKATKVAIAQKTQYRKEFNSLRLDFTEDESSPQKTIRDGAAYRVTPAENSETSNLEYLGGFNVQDGNLNMSFRTDVPVVDIRTVIDLISEEL